MMADTKWIDSVAQQCSGNVWLRNGERVSVTAETRDCLYSLIHGALTEISNRNFDSGVIAPILGAAENTVNYLYNGDGYRTIYAPLLTAIDERKKQIEKKAQEEKEYLHNALLNFMVSYQDLVVAMDTEEIDVNDYISENYPFESSFDEYVGILGWAETAMRKIENEER